MVVCTRVRMLPYSRVKDVKEGKIPKRWWWVFPVVVQGSGPRMTTAPQNARCPTIVERYMGNVCGVGVQRSTINLDLDAQTRLDTTDHQS